MKARQLAVTLAALLAVGATSFWAYRYEQRRETAGMCPFCDRMVHPSTSYHIERGGHEVVACCPRCGMHTQVNWGAGESGTAWATDLNTGVRVAAESATYVEGGDVQYCAHDDRPVERQPQGVSVREFDRCLPTLVAFKTAPEAEAYRRQHGGRVLTYAQALASIREH